MKRGEKKSTPPEMAKQIFSIVNLLPPGLELRDDLRIYETLCTEDLDQLIAKHSARFNEQGRERWEKLSAKEREEADIAEEFSHNLTYGFYHLKALKICLEGLPVEFKNYVKIPDSDPQELFEILVSSGTWNETYSEFLRIEDEHPGWLESYKHRKPTQLACSRYRTARSWYIQLYQLAAFSMDYIKNPERNYWPVTTSPVFLSVVNGRYDFELDFFTEAFRGLPVERLKLCENCGRVYWSRRSDTKVLGCSLPCSKVLRTRKWREKITPEKKRKYYVDRIHREYKKGEK